MFCIYGNQWEQVFQGRVACNPAHLRKNWGKRTKLWIGGGGGGGGMELGRVNIGMKTWH